MYVLKEDTDIIIFEDDKNGHNIILEYGESREENVLLCYIIIL